MKNLKILMVICCLAVLLTGCQKKENGNDTIAADVPLEDILNAVKEAYGEAYYPNMPLEEGTLSEQYGITSDLYDEAIGEVPMISTNADVFILIRAKEGKADQVEQILKDYRQDQIDNSLQYPMNIPRVEASVVQRSGNYVFYYILGPIDQDIYDQGEEAALNEARRQHEIAAEAIRKTLEK